MKKEVELNFRTYSDENIGSLSFFESKHDVPFNIQRIYFVYHVPLEKRRGYHAHKDLQQVLWCPYGEIEVILDDGNSKSKYILNSPEKALLVLRGIWHEMIWKKENSVLCVAASDFYNEKDYIRDYAEFLNYKRKGYWKNEN